MPDFSRMQWQQNREQRYSYELPFLRGRARRDGLPPLAFFPLPPALSLIKFD
jgi:hypothetical protein